METDDENSQPPSASSSENSSSSSSSCSSSSSSSSGNDDHEQQSIGTKNPDSSETNGHKPDSPNPRRPTNRALFQRIWSPADEITILKALTSYGSVPTNSASVAGFHASIAKSLSVQVTNGQLLDKIRRLRKRYMFANARTRSGIPPRFAKAHDRRVFEISKKIWRERPRERRRREWFPVLKETAEGMGNGVAMEGVVGLEAAAARGLEERVRWREGERMRVHLEKMELESETFRLIMEGVEGSSRA